MSGVKGRSGGRRAGSGPKPKTASARWLSGDTEKRGRIPPGQPPVPPPLAPVDAPEDLPSDQRAVWDALAPAAVRARTLTPDTAVAFRDLCEAIVIKRLMLAQITEDGLTSSRVTVAMDESGGGVQSVEPKAHPLLSKWTALMVRVEAGMARFLLSPNGKPTVVEAAPVDAFAEFDQGPQLVKHG